MWEKIEQGDDMTTPETDGIRADLRAIVEKIDKLMSREEYERRHASLEERVSKLETDMRSIATWSNSEHGVMRLDVATRFDKILEKFEDLKTEVLHSRSDNFKWALGIVLSFVLGGGLIGTLLGLHIIHP